jgi:hypothetical protein
MITAFKRLNYVLRRETANFANSSMHLYRHRAIRVINVRYFDEPYRYHLTDCLDDVK